MRVRTWLPLVVVVLLLAPARATTVIAPTFEQLVGEADIVFEGEVTETRSRLTVEGGRETIVTDVSFRNRRTLKGVPAAEVRLEFLGGVVGDRGFKVDGVPTFAKGDRDVVFAVTSKALVSPLVAMMYGRVRITLEGALNHETVHLFDGTPLRSVAALGSKEGQPRFSLEPAMSLAAFEGTVIQEVARQDALRRPRQ